MKNVLKIILFTVLVTAFYGYVGQMVPQKEIHPPKDLAVDAGMTVEELVRAGKQIAEGKGTCMGCHTIGSQTKGRFPDLAGIGARAGSRKPGLSAVDYLAETLYEPNAFIVEGYSPGMPPIGKPPIGLSDAEMLAVIAYLQSLGGQPTVTASTRLKYASEEPASPAAANPAPASAGASTGAGAAPGAPAALAPPEELLGRYGCLNCHGREPGVRTLGPNFHGIGNRLSAALIYESILEPDAVTAKGYPAGVMAATLKATGFYGKASAEEIKSMVAFLAASREGHPGQGKPKAGKPGAGKPKGGKRR